MEGLLRPLAGEQAGKFAGQLIRRFGGLGRALQSSGKSYDLSEEDQEALQLLNAAKALVSAAFAETLSGSPISASDASLLDYLRLHLGFADEEIAMVIFADINCGYVGTEVFAVGGSFSVAVPVRHIARRALELGARTVLLAHNHPSGCALPSDEDWRVTDLIKNALQTLEVALLDHLIVTRHATFSMRDGVRK